MFKISTVILIISGAKGISKAMKNICGGLVRDMNIKWFPELSDKGWTNNYYTTTTNNSTT